MITVGLKFVWQFFCFFRIVKPLLKPEMSYHKIRGDVSVEADRLEAWTSS